MADAYVFAGPSLPAFALQKHFSFAFQDGALRLANGNRIFFLPPVAEGDILRLLPENPAVIGIIDGYFENVPSVWHKEILYAMSQGIHVYGASSMGALRAAELAAFGMEGVGDIFRDFADGRLEDDDEVTVIHGPAEMGFPPLSEAMVNIRRNFAAAEAVGVISESEHYMLLRIAKEMNYKKRNYSRILSLARAAGLDAETAKRLEGWIAGSSENRKLADALLLVETVAEKMSQMSIEKKSVLYHFESTVIWEQARSCAPLPAIAAKGG